MMPIESDIHSYRQLQQIPYSSLLCVRACAPVGLVVDGRTMRVRERSGAQPQARRLGDATARHELLCLVRLPVALLEEEGLW